jgi:hypothetical protein
MALQCYKGVSSVLGAAKGHVICMAAWEAASVLTSPGGSQDAPSMQESSEAQCTTVYCTIQSTCKLQDACNICAYVMARVCQSMCGSCAYRP